MPSKAFKEIMAGLQDARAFLVDRDDSRSRLAQVSEDIDVTKLRAELGLSQTEFAIGFGVPVKTLQNWEQGRRVPKGPAKTLLTVIQSNPDVVLRTVWPQKTKRGRAGEDAR